MEALYLFIGLIISLTIGFAILLTGSTREDVIAHWADRRCGLDILMTAYMYKPDDFKAVNSLFSAKLPRVIIDESKIASGRASGIKVADT